MRTRRRITLLLLVPLVAVCQPHARSDEPHPADWVRVLEKGERDEWNAAIEALLRLKKLPRQSVATLIRRLEAMDADDRRGFARALYGKVARPETLRAAIELLADPDEKTAKAAYKAINSSREPFAIGILTEHVGRPHPRRAQLVDLLEARWREAETRRRGRDLDGVAVLEGIASGREREIFAALAPLLSDRDPEVRTAAARALLYVGDYRVRAAVFPLARDGDPEVRFQALRVLAWHGDERALEPLLEWADTAAPKDRRWHRNRAFRRVGGLFMHTRYADLFELYRSAKSDLEREDYKALVEGGLESEIIDNAVVMALMEDSASDPEPVIAEVATRLLSWRDKRDERPLAEGLGTGVLVGVALLAALLGLVLFHWAFRLLSLRRLFHRLTPSPIRSLALGHVALAGTVRAHGKTLEHPYTGEPCLYYPGADRTHPDVRFWIDDGTGRALVDPRQLVLLSEDGIVEEGEKVLIIGCARRSGETIEITQDDSPRSLYQRLIHFVVRRLLGRAAKSGSARLIFSDPSRCFCLWDDLGERPFASWRAHTMTFGVIALTGVWVVVFGLAALAIIDQELSASLKEALHRFWSAPE